MNRRVAQRSRMAVCALALMSGLAFHAPPSAAQPAPEPATATPARGAQPPPDRQAPNRPSRTGDRDQDQSDARERRRFRVTAVRFTGVSAVSKGALAGALATRASSRLPWGTKRYFSRAELQRDFRRIRAFYADRGYPRVRVDTYDLKLGRDTRRGHLSHHRRPAGAHGLD